MKLLLLSDINSAHTIKWATALASHAVDVLLIGFSALKHDKYSGVAHLKVLSLNQKISYGNAVVAKLKYLKAVSFVKNQISLFKPDILHAHYASSYGLIGALTKFRPFVLSVWGSDVYEFPHLSFLHKRIIKYNFKKADVLLSTSYNMAKECAKYTDKNILITPFGIDTTIFVHNASAKAAFFSPGDLVIGTVKSLEAVYNIGALIDAFYVLQQRYPQLPLKLLIVGDGSLKSSLQEKVFKLGISSICKFIEAVPNDKTPFFYSIIDIFVALSSSESFGVSVLEASACECPVVVSDVGGLPEVVEHDKSGYVVPSKDIDAAISAVEQLVLDKKLRQTMGKRGREKVMQQYEWKNNVQTMKDIYQTLLKK